MSCDAMEFQSLTRQDIRPNTGIERNAVEVSVIWNGTVQSVLERPLDEKGDYTFVIGEDPSCDYVVPGELVGGLGKFTLASVRGGVFETIVLPTMKLCVRGADGTLKRLDDDGELSLPNLDAVSTIVGRHDIAEVQVGTVVFRMRMSRPLDKIASSLSFDKRTSAFIGFSAFLHAAVLFALCLVPPDAAGFHMDSMDGGNRFMKIMLTAPEANLLEEKKPPVPEQETRATGEAHAGASGQMGERTAPKTNNHAGHKGPRDNVNIELMRETLKETASTAGILSILSASKMPTSPFGSDRPLGVDPETFLGALIGDQYGVNFGFGGLGPKGTGRGGGGNGTGGVGVGSLKTIGRWGGGGTCADESCPAWNTGHGKLGGRVGKGPGLTSGPVTVSGSLSKETIRRIVRRHLNEVRFCYEQGLQKRPDLSGQVAVRFVIGAAGQVQSFLVASSTIGDAAVEMCISKVVGRMSFPVPENNGIVIVTYPFSLTSSEG